MWLCLFSMKARPNSNAQQAHTKIARHSCALRPPPHHFLPESSGSVPTASHNGYACRVI
ncbi:unnamed protein product [Blumeria hordei]|uniref:Uncharacterized protein n=1 Tax=Blumeria hordei TaxID=2867405 RepID=A0A383UIE2_BLUHO|nr:unnamed protein product [Blumeria hordei]